MSKVRSRKLPLSPVITRAIKSGHVPALRNWRDLDVDVLTLGEKVCYFIENYIRVPEGELVGEKVHLLPFQEAFIISIFDGKVRARRAILSVGRKAGKTTVISCLMIAFMFMRDLIKPNCRINSAALSRDQASLVFTYMSKSLRQSPELEGKYRITPSGKHILSLTTGIEYTALASDAGTAMGLSPAVIVGDEWGQVTGQTNDFIDSLLTSQGAHSNPLAIIISTQAADDSSWLSVAIDDATRSPTDEVVCHLYTADKSLALDDPLAWEQACPAVGVFRSKEDVRVQAEQALRLPTSQAAFENLILNRRVALSGLWLAPAVWKDNSEAPDLEVFQRYGAYVSLGLDLSMRNDLTAAVISTRDDDEVIHLIPFCFTPEKGIAERELRDKIPYQAWVRDGLMCAVPGATLDYKWLCEFLKMRLDDLGINISTIQFDRWRINEFKHSAEQTGFGSDAEWVEVGQGYIGFSPRVEHFETYLLQGKMRHGAHPLLNMAAAGAVVTKDPAGNRKIDKSKTASKIDPLVAAVMSAGAFMSIPAEIDVAAWIV